MVNIIFPLEKIWLSWLLVIHRELFWGAGWGGEWVQIQFTFSVSNLCGSSAIVVEM